MSAGSALMVLLALCQAPAGEPGTEELLVRAQHAFQMGLAADMPAEERKMLFARAFADFTQVRERGYSNPALYGNIGNAALLAGHWPEAILAYRQGLKLTPRDRTLTDGLAAARRLAAAATRAEQWRDPAEHRPAWLPSIGPAWLLVLDSICHLSAWLALVRWWMVRRGRWLATAGLLGIVAVLLMANCLIEARATEFASERPLVVVKSNDVPLRLGNGLSYPAVGKPLGRGTEAYLVHERQDWVQIELGNGEVGWLPRGAVLIDKPG